MAGVCHLFWKHAESYYRLADGSPSRELDHFQYAGTWVHLPAGQRHGIQATTPVVMLLMLLKEPHP